MTLGESNQEVIRCFLMACAGWPDSEALDHSALCTFLAEREREIRTLSEQALQQAAMDHHDAERRRRLPEWRWEKCRIPLQDFGPWRTVGDALPLEACRESAIEAAAFITRYPETFPGARGEELRRYQEHVHRIRRLQKFASGIRGSTLQAVVVVEREQRGRQGCRTLRYASEDGSHRAIALALAGDETIAAWIGSPN